MNKVNSNQRPGSPRDLTAQPLSSSLPDVPPIVMGSADLAVGRWIVGQGLNGPSLANLLEGACEQLLLAGIPIWRTSLIMPVINPDLKAINLRWQRGGSEIEQEAMRHDDDPEEFQRSPFWRMVQDGESRRRWRLGFELAPTSHPILEKLRTRGATDYLAYVIYFDHTDTLALRGCAISFATDDRAGFSDEDVARLSGVVSLLALAAYRFGTSDILVEMLGCYVGLDAGQRVLRGEIRRGVGHHLPAALLFADLRGFTGVAEGSGKGLIARLGQHLAAMAEPVEAQGGEVLKVLGDGLLAGFPISEGREPHEACAAATEAAIEALALNTSVNALHPNEPPLLLDIALHCGEVFYGNVGAGRRLDFTVIGPAVNEASRIETMCSVLNEPLLMSEPFALCCPRPVVSLGHHKLRGVATERELFSLA